ncbi:MAG: dTDP-glucose 4,6-dehydratase [Candidatus Omnitrophota bacterium]
MRILVTGGAGFIGSNFIRYILSKDNDCRVVNLDKLSYAGNLENLTDIESNPRYGFIKGDICDYRVVDKAVSECDVVVNFAAESHVDRSILNSSDFVMTNVFGTNVLLDASRKFKIKKFIQVSTDEVYGSVEDGSFREDNPLRPNSPYSASKAGAEHLCRSYFVTFGLPVVITRSSNNFGPYQYPEKFLPLSVTNLMEGRNIPIYGDGMNVRDWIYVEDNCDALYFLLKNGQAGETYNIAGGCEIANIDMAKSLLKLMGKPISMIEYVKDRPGHDKRYSISDSKIKSCGWAPKNEFPDALRRTIEWYQDNQGWWKKIKHKSADYKSYHSRQYETGKQQGA